MFGTVLPNTVATSHFRSKENGIKHFPILMSYDYPTSTASRAILLVLRRPCPQCFIKTSLTGALSSVQFSHSVMSDSLWPHGLQHARSPCPGASNSRSLPKLVSIESVMPSNHLSLCVPFSSCLQSFQHQGLFKWVSSLHQVAKILEFQL